MLMKVAKGIDGVAFLSRLLEFVIEDLKGRFVCDGDFDHFPALFFCGPGGVWFQGGLGCGDKEDFIEPQRFHGIVGNDQMPRVDGVKGATK